MNKKTEDFSSLTGFGMNRIRQVGHTEGQFATLVYIPASADFCSILREHLDDISRIIDAVEEASKPVLSPSVWEPIASDDQHMSLTRTLFVKSHLKDSFLARLCESIQLESDSCVYLSNIVRLYTNDEGNTAFVGIPVDASISPYVCRIIRRIDTVLSEFGLPKFYDNPDPHITIAYTTDVDAVKRLRDKSGQDFGCLDLSEEEADRFRICADRIHIKIGNQIHLV